MARSNKEELLKSERALAEANGLSADDSKLVGMFQLAYAKAAEHFEHYVAEKERDTAKVWKRACLFTSGLAIMSIAAVMGLTPLKENTPYMTLVDKVTGAATVIGPGGKKVSGDFQGDMYWLNLYVLSQESYTYASQDDALLLVQAMSDPGVFNEYRNFQLSSKGYLVQLGKKGQVKTTLDNLIPVKTEGNERSAQAWFTKTVLDENGVPVANLKPVSWQALITYRYDEPSKDLKQLMLNPREFRVSSYQRFQQLGGGQ